MGRASLYTPEIAEEIVRRIAAGEPLTHICRDEHMPAKGTVDDWKQRYPDFKERFLKARDDGFDAIAEDSMAIVDAPPERCNTEHGDKVDAGYVAWQKNRAEQRLKLLAKWDPRRYGDKQQVEHSGGIAVTSLAGKMRERRKPDAGNVEDLL